MRVVGENSASAIARHRAKQQIDDELRELTSNLIRVIRGAGQPYSVARQAAAYVAAVAELQDLAGGHLPAAELTPMLSVWRPWNAEPVLSGLESRRQSAIDQIISGALQITASRLLGQRTQETAGRTEMLDGVRDLEKVQADARAERHRAELEAAGVKRRTRKVAGKRVTSKKVTSKT